MQTESVDSLYSFFLLPHSSFKNICMTALFFSPWGSLVPISSPSSEITSCWLTSQLLTMGGDICNTTGERKRFGQNEVIFKQSKILCLKVCNIFWRYMKTIGSLTSAGIFWCFQGLFFCSLRGKSSLWKFSRPHWDSSGAFQEIHRCVSAIFLTLSRNSPAAF